MRKGKSMSRILRQEEKEQEDQEKQEQEDRVEERRGNEYDEKQFYFSKNK